MARIRLDLPAELPFTTRIVVRITDLNYGNHLGNDRLLGMLHEARVRYFASEGWTEYDLAGRAIVMSDVAICYLAEGFAGDELDVEVGLTEPMRVACDVVYRVVRIRDCALGAEAKTGIVFLDPESRRPAAGPLVPLYRQWRTRVLCRPMACRGGSS